MGAPRAARVAAIYDLHGNLPALDAVLEEVRRADVDLIVLGGDYAWGPQPREVVERVQELTAAGALAIRGNADREVASRADEADGLDPATAAINTWCADALSADQRDWLAALPESAAVEVAGSGTVHFCHGSPRGDEEAITDRTPTATVLPMLAGVRADVVVVGHTHLQFRRAVGAIEVVNPGSVGLPFGDAGAYWALLGPEIELRRTDYDARAASAAFLRGGCPDAAGFGDHAVAPPGRDVGRSLHG